MHSHSEAISEFFVFHCARGVESLMDMDEDNLRLIEFGATLSSR